MGELSVKQVKLVATGEQRTICHAASSLNGILLSRMLLSTQTIFTLSTAMSGAYKLAWVVLKLAFVSTKVQTYNTNHHDARWHYNLPTLSLHSKCIPDRWEKILPHFQFCIELSQR